MRVCLASQQLQLRCQLLALVALGDSHALESHEAAGGVESLMWHGGGMGGRVERRRGIERGREIGWRRGVRRRRGIGRRMLLVNELLKPL